ncbi:putative oxygenase MesX, partial [Serratia sp. CY74664]
MPRRRVGIVNFRPIDLLSDYTDLELIGTISTMETF